MSRHSPSSLARSLAIAAVSVGVGTAFATPDPSLEWHHLHDGGSQLADTGIAVLSDPSGNPVIAGEITDAEGNGNLLVRKLDRETGDPLWSRSVLGTPENTLALGGMVWDGFGNLLIGGTRLGCYG